MLHPLSSVDILRNQGIVFDEGAARFDFVAHQGNEHFVGGDGVFDAHFQQTAHGGIHRGFPKLFGVHLAQTFVSLDGHAFLGVLQQDVQRGFKAVHVVLVLAFIKLGALADQAFEGGGGLGEGLVGFAVEELGFDVADHDVAVQLAGDFDEAVAFVSFDAFEGDFFFVEQTGKFGNGFIGVFRRRQIDGRRVQHGAQDEFVHEAAFLFDNGFRQQELFGGIGKFCAFDGAAA